MRELGELSAALHRDVGRRAGAVVDALYTIGDLGRAISEAAIEAGAAPDAVRHVSSVDEAADELARELRASDVLLVKGSRAMALERVVDALSRRAR